MELMNHPKKKRNDHEQSPELFVSFVSFDPSMNGDVHVVPLYGLSMGLRPEAIGDQRNKPCQGTSGDFQPGTSLSSHVLSKPCTTTPPSLDGRVLGVDRPSRDPMISWVVPRLGEDEMRNFLYMNSLGFITSWTNSCTLPEKRITSADARCLVPFSWPGFAGEPPAASPPPPSGGARRRSTRAERRGRRRRDAERSWTCAPSSDDAQSRRAAQASK